MKFPATILLNAHPRLAVPIAHSLNRRGIPVVCAFFGPEQQPVRSRAIRQNLVFGLLDVTDSDLLQELILTMEREGIDYLLPCNDSAVGYVVHHYASLHESIKLGCPAPEILLRVLNKGVTLALARQCGIPIPNEVGNPVSLEQIEHELSFPVVVKLGKKMEYSDFKVRYCNNIDALREVAQKSPDFFNHYLVQEYCPGQGVGVEVLMHAGRPVMVFQHRRVAEYPRSGGVSAIAVSEAPEPRLVSMAIRLLKAIQWQGPAMVEFKHDTETGRVALMEVNGRYWGSLGLSAMCGFDFPYVQWALDHGIDVDIPAGYRVGVRAWWSTGIVGNLINALDGRPGEPSLGAELRKSMSELSPATKDMVFDWKDPLPAIQEAGQLLKREMSSITKRRLRSSFPRSIANIQFVRRHGLAFAGRLKWRSMRRRVRPPQLPANVKSILFVCHGNIIRSALAEHLLRKRLPPGSELTVGSAGMFAVDGKPADPRVIRAALRLFDLDLSAHCATRLNSDQVSRSDVIFVMDHQNEIALLQSFPHATAKLFLLGELRPDGSTEGDEIPDPYNGTEGDVADCCIRISNCLDRALLALGSSCRNLEMTVRR